MKLRTDLVVDNGKKMVSTMRPGVVGIAAVGVAAVPVPLASARAPAGETP